MTSLLKTKSLQKPSEWTEENLKLSKKYSVSGGKVVIKNAEYVRDILDEFIELKTKQIVWMSTVQSTKTSVILFLNGYFTKCKPTPILNVYETDDKAKIWSKTRLDTLYKENRCFKGIVTDRKTKGSDSVLFKDFPDGVNIIGGAKSPSTLSSHSVGCVFADEVSLYPDEVKGVGDPLKAIDGRITAFWDGKVGLFSTPGFRGKCKIEKAYLGTDQRRFYVPCELCSHFQKLLPSGLHVPLKKHGFKDRVNAGYICEKCDRVLTDQRLKRNVQHGYWKATRPFEGKAGFWTNAFYSPFVSLYQIAQGWHDAKKEGRSALKVFIPQTLGETFIDNYQKIDRGKLSSRLEDYQLIPKEAAILTCGCDVQGDRIEAIVWAFGMYEEMWFVEHKIFPGRPEEPQVWKDLESFLYGTWQHESGKYLRIRVTCIDSGGRDHWSKIVCNFVKHKQKRGIYAIKGGTKQDAVFITAPHEKAPGTPLIMNVHQGKGIIYSSLELKEPGPAYMHLSEKKNHNGKLMCDEEFLKQLLAEVLKPKMKEGKKIGEYWDKIRKRNEILDMTNYALGGFHTLGVTHRRMAELLQEVNSNIEIIPFKRRVINKKEKIYE